MSYLLTAVGTVLVAVFIANAVDQGDRLGLVEDQVQICMDVLRSNEVLK